MSKPIAQVKVIVHATTEREGYCEFRLIFPDNYEKYYRFSEYEFRCSRRSFRQLIEDQVEQYYELQGLPTPIIQLMFF